jgi:hypothetical protein
MSFVLGAATLIGTVTSLVGVSLALRTGQRRKILDEARYVAEYCKVLARRDQIAFGEAEPLYNGRLPADWNDIHYLAGLWSKIEAEGRSPRSRRETRWEIQRRYAMSPKASVPSWAMRFFDPADARRYSCEWGAHLWQLVAEGEIKRARRIVGDWPPQPSSWQ